MVGGIGENANYPGMSAGFEAGIRTFNEAGGLDGRQIKYVGLLDDNYVPAAVLTNAQQLVEADHVFAVVPFNDQVAGQSLVTYLAQQKIPFIGFGVTLPFINNPWAWSVVGDVATTSESAQAQYLELKNALHTTGPRMKFALITHDIAVGATTLKISSAGIRSIGAKIVYSEATVPVSGTISFAPYAQAIIASGANVVYEELSLPASVGLSAALRSAGYKGAVLNGDYLPGQLASSPSEEAALQGNYASSDFPASESNTPAVRQAIRQLSAVGAPPYLGGGASVGYWSAQLFIAMLKATSTKVGSAAKVTPQAMYKVVNAGFTYQGTLAGGLGSESFPGAEHAPTTCYSLSQVKGATFEPREPYQCIGKIVPVPNSGS